MHRRHWFQSIAALAAARAPLAGMSPAPEQPTEGLPLEKYEPRSMLHVPESTISRSRFPVIDIHTHLSFSTGLGEEKPPHENAKPEDVLAVMDRRNIRMMVNLTAGYGEAFLQVRDYWHTPHPDRFLVFTEPWYNKAAEPGYARFQAEEIERAHRAGARGIKVLKTLGLYLRENITAGPLVKVDDRRFDPMWETAAALKMPVAIHTSDPLAFFLPIDRFNERWEELHAHPDWSFHGRDFPSDAELQEARLRVIARHRKTQFLCLHVAEAENLPLVSEWMDRHPNMLVDIAARIGELGRQPRTARKFFERYQDRILFGTDAVPHGEETPQQVLNDRLYEIYFRFLETEDEYFDYAPALVPPQGRWRIYGLGLPEEILRKVYYENAERLLGMKS